MNLEEKLSPANKEPGSFFPKLHLRFSIADWACPQQIQSPLKLVLSCQTASRLLRLGDSLHADLVAG